MNLINDLIRRLRRPRVVITHCERCKRRIGSYYHEVVCVRGLQAPDEVEAPDA